jgi:ABC-2 type transport system permease protein
MFGRYVRLWLALAKFSLLRELAFRANFVVKMFVEVLWLAILLLFYQTVFRQTNHIEGWSQPQYLFFVGVNFVVAGLLETLFLENCNNFADLVRTGDLDFILLRPMDEQFLVSCRTVDWSCLPTILMGTGVMLFALADLPWPGWGTIVLFPLLLAIGCALAYGFLLLLTAASVWFMRNQSLMEMWWLFTTLMRYPREIFRGPVAERVGWLFTFAVPIMLVTNVPAHTMAKVLDPTLALYSAVAMVAVLAVSRWFFRRALARYRSASS